ncbi:MAG TPA: TIGR03767 family metallophosphoesterase, partial [Acidimicrobiales bacterium]|nr:TIGR03767 family metallophosphoesterase [Acidimicrobiales bacterium]
PPRWRSLLAFVQLSDLHITDVQSPARIEFLDRHGDDDSPHAAALGRVGVYRAQEALTFQVLEAMTRAVRAALDAGGPATGAPFAFAVSTGDNVDNCQRNELDAYLTLLEGGEVRPDSGDPQRYEGVGGPDCCDERYWHPDGTPAGAEDDLPRAQRGFPTVPGLLDACRRPFLAGGIGLPWYAVYGNHDSLLVGTTAPDKALGELVVGGSKPVAFAGEIDPVELLAETERGPAPISWGEAAYRSRPVTPDPQRRFVDPAEWLAAHLEAGGDPSGHGFDAAAVAAERAYYAADAGLVRLLVLDTVNREGGWQGSLDAEQLAWLEGELVAGHASYLDAEGEPVRSGNPDRLFVLFSHHSLETLINPYSLEGAVRLLGDDLVALLGRFSNVVAYVNGHTHEHAVRPVPAGLGGFWQVTTGSHIDWPQQCRLVELALDEESGDVLVVTELLDHAGLVDPRLGEPGDPMVVAGWSRELSANAWQGRSRPEEPWGRGQARDRNCVLVWPAPFPVAEALGRLAAAPEGGRAGAPAGSSE